MLIGWPIVRTSLKERFKNRQPKGGRQAFNSVRCKILLEAVVLALPVV